MYKNHDKNEDSIYTRCRYQSVAEKENISINNSIVLELKLLAVRNVRSFHSFSTYREVTGFVLFYDVNNLVTLRDLFPNLMVIRGQKLIGSYALIFYAVPQLQEVSMISLVVE